MSYLFGSCAVFELHMTHAHTSRMVLRPPPKGSLSLCLLAMCSARVVNRQISRATHQFVATRSLRSAAITNDVLCFEVCATETRIQHVSCDAILCSLRGQLHVSRLGYFWIRILLHAVFSSLFLLSSSPGFLLAITNTSGTEFTFSQLACIMITNCYYYLLHFPALSGPSGGGNQAENMYKILG